MRDTYNSPAEQEPLRRYLENGDLDQGWRSGWFEQLAEWKRAGKRFHRVRLVSVPLTPYSKWGMLIAARSNEEGDDIRYLDRADAGALPDYDYWLFDSKLVAKMHFGDGDAFVSFELIEDPAVVVEHNYWRDAAWHHAVTRDEFAAEHGQQR
ncbi:hypothetical protein C8K30_11541 [Promicromonospora sp. AC04]|uniref:DUF6879 family protein n=1 Tax=Promicromonospora sp. AC04 TaxID=2135723 RepID=UPI000D3F3E8F|nr:DUF6879 family protein [Promicromonospora sp. AC04]PUB20830.1 hypothetical protein C8K30_11541 [Promicromonospora sp. AC04]